jgi:hypothetical protein
MTIARAQMYRQLYQLGGSPIGIQSLPMDYGTSLQVPSQQQPMFTSTGNSTSSPLLNYGQTPLGKAGGTPLIRNSYQEGGLTDFYKAEEPIIPRIENIGGLLDQAEKSIGEPQNNFTSPLATTFSRFGMQEGGMGIMGAIPQEAGMSQQEGSTEQTALLTIIQLLIEQGISPEQAEELAMQILQVFNQGGQPAVEEFANQLEQEEGMPENRTMMAGGGITGIYPRQGYFFKGAVKAVTGAVKGVAKAVKSIAKSPIGQIALAIAAPYAIGALAPGFATLGGSGFMGAALRAGISNLAIQGITTGKINPKQALLAAVGGGVAQGVFGPAGGATTDISQGTLNAGGAGIPGADIATTSTLTSGVTPSLPISSFPELAGQVQPNSMVYNPPTNAAGIYPELANQVSPTSSVVNVGAQQPNIFQQGITSIKDFGTNLMTDPLKTLGNVGSSVYQSAKDNALPLATGFLAGSSLAQQPGESDDEYASRAARDPQVAAYITRYGGGIGLRSSSFYQMEKAVDPFAGTSFSQSTNPFYPQGYSTGGRIGYEGGSMPMGEPRRNPAGIMELDYRRKGGFVPPIGIKEKADDIPAMLSNNEFVFTANAVRNAGDGNVNKGAQRMYSLMKNLENGGRV